MSLFEQVREEIQEALREQARVRLAALRNIRASFLEETKRDGSESLSDDACIALLRRLAKQRRESIEAFAGAGREEQAEAEREELAVIEAYLPSLADQETTLAWVRDAVEASGATSSRDLGSAMGALMRTHKGEVDAALARKLLSQQLSD